MGFAGTVLRFDRQLRSERPGEVRSRQRRDDSALAERTHGPVTGGEQGGGAEEENRPGEPACFQVESWPHGRGEVEWTDW
jgi:hypothetical protein